MTDPDQDPDPDERETETPHPPEWQVVGYHPIRCPDCGSRSHRQYGREGRLRYHRCKQCSLRYRSWEDISGHKQSWLHP